MFWTTYQELDIKTLRIAPLHGDMFHGLPEIALGPPPRGRPDANSNNPCQWYGLWTRIKSPHGYGPWLCMRSDPNMYIQILGGIYKIFILEVGKRNEHPAVAKRKHFLKFFT